MKYFKTLIIFIILFILSCDVSSPEETGKVKIRTILEDIELAFNLHHIEEIMEYYNSSYLHNGEDIDDVRLDWEIRLNDYEEMELSEINIELDGDRATVTLKRSFYINQELVLQETEPDDNGDLSYWQLEMNEWKIIGNRNSRSHRFIP